MALTKSIKLLLTIGSVVGIGAIGIGTGLGLGLNDVAVNNSSFDKEFNENKTTNNSPNFSLNTTNKVDLNDLLTRIDQSSIIIHPFFSKDELRTNPIRNDAVVNTNATVNRSDVFAFNLKKQQLGLKGVEISEDVSVNLSFDETKNTTTNLNNGLLSVRIDLSQTGNVLATKVIDLKGFKTPDMTLKKLLTSSSQQTPLVTLSITPQMSGDTIPFTSIEQLNAVTEIKPKAALHAQSDENVTSTNSTKESGLTTWLKKDSTKMAMEKNISIIGEVKLDKIELEQDKPVFYLSSANKNSPLKLVQMMSDKKTNEALFDQIKTTNLLASDVTIVLSETSPNKNQNYIDELSKLTNTHKYLNDDQNPSLNRILSVNLAAKQEEEQQQTMIDRLFVKPQVFIRNKTAQLQNKIGVYAVVTYGSNKTAKTYSTNDAQDLKLLSETGFKFNVYSKKLDTTQYLVGSDDVTNTNNSLNTFFKEANYLSPVAKPVMNNSQISNMGNFKVTTIPVAKTNSGVVELDLGDEKFNDVNQKQQTKPENYLVFADYSFKGFKQEKVIFNPVISLIHATTLNSNGELVKKQNELVAKEIKKIEADPSGSTGQTNPVVSTENTELTTKPTETITNNGEGENVHQQPPSLQA